MLSIFKNFKLFAIDCNDREFSLLKMIPEISDR